MTKGPQKTFLDGVVCARSALGCKVAVGSGEALPPGTAAGTKLELRGQPPGEA